MFRLAVFNVLSVNEDDHLKNVAWLMDDSGTWRLSPGFDLTYAPQPHGERATTVAGLGRGVGRAQLLELASRVGLKPRLARKVLEEVCAATAQVESVLEAARCTGPVSRAAAHAVREASARAQA